MKMTFFPFLERGSALMKKWALPALILLGVGIGNASAQTLSAATETTSSSITTSGDDGYIFFSPTTSGNGDFVDLFSLPGYATLGTFTGTGTGTFNSVYLTTRPTFAPATPSSSPGVSAANRYSFSYKTLSINSTSYTTGIDYQGSASQSSLTPSVLGAIQLGSSVPSSFTVSFLLDNAGGSTQYDESVSLLLENSSGTVLSTSPLETSTPSTAADDFYSSTVSNAVNGDFLVLTAYNLGGGTGSGDDVEVGGITFVTLAPEPSTWALFGVSLIGGIAFLVKRRSSASNA